MPIMKFALYRGILVAETLPDAAEIFNFEIKLLGIQRKLYDLLPVQLWRYFLACSPTPVIRTPTGKRPLSDEELLSPTTLPTWKWGDYDLRARHLLAMFRKDGKVPTQKAYMEWKRCFLSLAEDLSTADRAVRKRIVAEWFHPVNHWRKPGFIEANRKFKEEITEIHARATALRLQMKIWQYFNESGVKDVRNELKLVNEELQRKFVERDTVLSALDSKYKPTSNVQIVSERSDIPRQ